MSFARDRPYERLPLLPPGRNFLERPSVLRSCISAGRVLAELKGASRLLPDPSMLINSIPLQEARLSSEIENIVTTQDELYIAAIDTSEPTDPHTKEVLRYRSALHLTYERVKERGLALSLLREICSELLGAPMGFRQAHETVRLANPGGGEVRYTPPSGGPMLLDKLQNLLDFAQGQGEAQHVDPLLRMAIAHYQFEAIHPFLDGNGRTGRILNLALLVHDGLLDLPLLCLSRFILHNKAQYYQSLQDVSERKNWEGWLVYMMRAVEETARWTMQRIEDVQRLMQQTLERCRQELPKRVYSKELVELIFRQPYCKIAFVVEADLAKRQTAATYLQALEQIGVLSGEKHGREVIYRHSALIDILSA